MKTRIVRVILIVMMSISFLSTSALATADAELTGTLQITVTNIVDISNGKIICVDFDNRTDETIRFGWSGSESAIIIKTDAGAYKAPISQFGPVVEIGSSSREFTVGGVEGTVSGVSFTNLICGANPIQGRTLEITDVFDEINGTYSAIVDFTKIMTGAELFFESHGTGGIQASKTEDVVAPMTVLDQNPEVVPAESEQGDRHATNFQNTASPPLKDAAATAAYDDSANTASATESDIASLLLTTTDAASDGVEYLSLPEFKQELKVGAFSWAIFIVIILIIAISQKKNRMSSDKEGSRTKKNADGEEPSYFPLHQGTTKYKQEILTRLTTFKKRVEEGSLDEAAMQLRHILEYIVDGIWLERNWRAWPTEAKLLDRIDLLFTNDLITAQTQTHYHEVRKITNQGAHVTHGKSVSERDISLAHKILILELNYYFCGYNNRRDPPGYTIGKFTQEDVSFHQHFPQQGRWTQGRHDGAVVDQDVLKNIAEQTEKQFEEQQRLFDEQIRQDQQRQIEEQIQHMHQIHQQQFEGFCQQSITPLDQGGFVPPPPLGM